MIHNFNESLARSHAAEDLPFWEECYRSAFGDQFCMMACHRENGDHQKAGIDRSITLINSKQLLVDEKVRFKDYSDIALEYISNDRTKAPGWVCKSLLADYIAYAIAPKGICYLLPVPQLQVAWKCHSTDWIAKFRTVVAQNNGYRTISVAVPVDVLFPAIGNALRVKFTPFTEVN